MSDNPKKIQFRKNATEQTPEKNAAKEGTPLRDQDNAKPMPPPPRISTKPAPNLAPPGMAGIKKGTPQKTVTPTHQSGIEIHRPWPEDSRYTDGKLTSMPGYSFQAMLEPDPTEKAIEGGKISRLDVHKDGKLVARYEDGWQKKPETAQDKEALLRIRNGLEDTPRDQFKGIDHSKDKGHGHSH